MPEVFVVGEQPRNFHNTPTCRKIKTGQKGKPRANKTRSVDLDTLTTTKPCLVCYPDAPRLRAYRPRCAECGTTHPCPHNGGVEVEVIYVRRVRGSGGDAVETVSFRRFVRADHAYRYRQVGDHRKS